MLNAANRPSFGSDPEAFFKRGDQIIGSEKLIPEKGIRTYTGKVVRDGVQFELNPVSSKHIDVLACNIAKLLSVAQQRANKAKGTSICFDGLVEVSREELDSLSPGSRILGCMPSTNVYEERPITVDPYEYRKRSSGGHIHFGIFDKVVMRERRRMVPLCDILIGNTLALLDRDPGAAERRQNYGRAGECRFPEHGLEYRTISNFWLRDYALMSLTFSLAGIVYDFATQSMNGNKSMWDDLAKRVKVKQIVQAIDTNDFTLAMKNFKKIVPFLKKYLPKEGYALTPTNLDAFIGFAEVVNTKGIDTFFPTERIIPKWIEGPQVSFSEFVKR